MPRNGTVTLDNAIVMEVSNVKSGTSRVVVRKQAWSLTFERSGPLPDGMDLRPDDTVDITVGFDQRMKAP